MSRLAAVLLACALTSACSTPPKASAPAPALAHQELWGEIKPVVSVKELMRDFIDPASDYVFNSVSIVTTSTGTIETTPKSEAEWERLRIGGVMLAEGVALLKVPRPFAPPGDENNSTGPDPEELSPAQIKAKLEADPVLWTAKIQALRNINLAVLEIVKRKDVKELSDAGEILDQACESCHLEFWYPAEKDRIKKLDRRLQGR